MNKERFDIILNKSFNTNPRSMYPQKKKQIETRTISKPPPTAIRQRKRAKNTKETNGLYTPTIITALTKARNIPIYLDCGWLFLSMYYCMERTIHESDTIQLQRILLIRPLSGLKKKISSNSWQQKSAQTAIIVDSPFFSMILM